MSVAIAFAFSFFDHFSFYSSQITSHRLQRHVHKLLADNNQTHNPSIVRDSHIISSRVFLPLSFSFSICRFSFFALSPLLCVFVLINNCGLNFSSNFFFHVFVSCLLNGHKNCSSFMRAMEFCCCCFRVNVQCTSNSFRVVSPLGLWRMSPFYSVFLSKCINLYK